MLIILKKIVYLIDLWKHLIDTEMFYITKLLINCFHTYFIILGLGDYLYYDYPVDGIEPLAEKIKSKLEKI